MIVKKPPDLKSILRMITGHPAVWLMLPVILAAIASQAEIEIEDEVIHIAGIPVFHLRNVTGRLN